MSKKYRILNIARNIPVPGIKENDIIFRISNDLKKTTNFNFDFWFPKEFIPRIPLLKGRTKAIAKLPNIFISNNYIVNSINYIRLPSIRFSYVLLNLFILFNYKKIQKCRKYNLIVAHYIMPDGYIGLKIKEKFGIPLIVVMRSGDLTKMSNLSKRSKVFKMYNKVLDRADKIIVHNYSTENFIKGRNLHYIKIPHGIEKKYIQPFRRNKLNIIISISQLISRKNLDWLIKVFKQNNLSDWKLLIIGEGNHERYLKTIANKDKNISFLGRLPREDVLKILRDAAIFVLPSDNETFGLVYLEAAVNSCAIIGKRYTGIYGWLEEKKEALFVSSKDELEIKLKKIISDKKYRNLLSQAAYNKVTKEMTWDEQISKYIAEYKNLIK